MIGTERAAPIDKQSASTERGMRIAAIVPLYNGSATIEAALTSILRQTVPVDEIIVVDDGSTDDGAGANIVRRMAESAPITLRSKANGGQSSARNYGVSCCQSDLIALLDQDDIWYPEHIERLSKPFREGNARIGWVYSNVDIIDSEGKLTNYGLLTNVGMEHPKRTLDGCLRTDMFILPSASLIARSAFLAEGGFDERLSGYEDDDLFLRMFRGGHVNIYLDESLSQWRITGETASYTPRMARSRLLYASKLMATFPDDPMRGQYFVRELIAPRFVHTLKVEAWRNIRRRDSRGMRAALADALTLTPHLRLSDRLKIRIATWVLRDWRTGRLAFRAAFAARRMMQRA